MISKKVMITLIIIFTIISAVSVAIICKIMSIKASAKKYVQEVYNLTPTESQLSLSIDGMDSVTVWTKELPFYFDVYLHIENGQVWCDTYLESLIEYKLEQLVLEKLPKYVDEHDICVTLESTVSTKNPPVTIDEVNADPSILINNPNVDYDCSVFNTDLSMQTYFIIYSRIVNNFNPTDVTFSYINKKGEIDYASIDNSEFSEINNVYDLSRAIKEKSEDTE